MISRDIKLRSKRELIEKFIMENLPLISEDIIEESFETFMNEEKQKAFDVFVNEENLNADNLKELIEDYLFSQRTPTQQEVIKTLEKQPSILNRKNLGETLMMKFMNFVVTFFDD